MKEKLEQREQHGIHCKSDSLSVITVSKKKGLSLKEEEKTI
jgi:hypothetical protein